MVPVDFLGPINAECFDLYFTGVGSARVYAKYLRPKGLGGPAPTVLQFHGYSMSSGDWSEKLNFVNEGYVVKSPKPSPAFFM